MSAMFAEFRLIVRVEDDGSFQPFVETPDGRRQRPPIAVAYSESEAKHAACRYAAALSGLASNAVSVECARVKWEWVEPAAW